MKRAKLFARGRHCSAVEHRLNIFMDALDMLALCEEENLASINRVPLLIGLLTGRWRRGDSPRILIGEAMASATKGSSRCSIGPNPFVRF